MPLHHYGRIPRPGRLVCAVWFRRPGGCRREWSSTDVSRHKNDSYGAQGYAVVVLCRPCNPSLYFLLAEMLFLRLSSSWKEAIVIGPSIAQGDPVEDVSAEAFPSRRRKVWLRTARSSQGRAVRHGEAIP